MKIFSFVALAIVMYSIAWISISRYQNPCGLSKRQLQLCEEFRHAPELSRDALAWKVLSEVPASALSKADPSIVRRMFGLPASVENNVFRYRCTKAVTLNVQFDKARCKRIVITIGDNRDPREVFPNPREALRNVRSLGLYSQMQSGNGDLSSLGFVVQGGDNRAGDRGAVVPLSCHRLIKPIGFKVLYHRW